MTRPSNPRSSRDRPAGLTEFAHLTGEKTFLANCIASYLPTKRERFLDVGGGNGELTALVGCNFGRVTAIEPRASHGAELRAVADCVIPKGIQEASLESDFDLILMSHALGYLPQRERLPTVMRLAQSLRPAGRLVVIANNPSGTAAAVVRHFARTIVRRRWAPVDLRAISRAMQRGGFFVRVRTCTQHVAFASAHQAVRFVSFLASDLHGAPADHHSLASFALTQKRRDEFRFTMKHDLLLVSRS